MAYSIAVWNWTPDTWSQEVGLGSTSLAVIQDDNSKVVSIDGSGWVDTLLTVVDNTAFETYGVPLGDIGALSKTDWQDLYTNFTPPFKVHLFKEEDEISQNKLNVMSSQKDYTVARSYEATIDESDLEKVKSINVV